MGLRPAAPPLFSDSSAVNARTRIAPDTYLPWSPDKECVLVLHTLPRRRTRVGATIKNCALVLRTATRNRTGAGAQIKKCTLVLHTVPRNRKRAGAQINNCAALTRTVALEYPPTPKHKS